MRYAILPAPLFALALAACEQPPVTGEQLFAANCASCHGTDATGGTMPGAPDLTTIARRKGGFSYAYVMSTIDGYLRDDTHGPMPEFGALLESEMEVWTDDNGVPTPTPSALLKLAGYLEGLQR